MQRATNQLALPLCATVQRSTAHALLMCVNRSRATPPSPHIAFFPGQVVPYSAVQRQMPKVKHSACEADGVKGHGAASPVLRRPARLKVLLINYQLARLTLTANGKQRQHGKVRATIRSCSWHLNNCE